MLDYAETLNDLARAIYSDNLKKGFWEKHERNFGETMMLVVTELAEAVEAARHGNPQSTAIPGYSSVLEELADAIIRIMDYCGGIGLDIGGAIMRKLEYNKLRPYKHGKEF